MILLSIQAEEGGQTIEDAVQAADLARLVLELPKLIPLIPSVGGENPALVHRAAVQQMATELLKKQTQLAGLGMVSLILSLRILDRLSFSFVLRGHSSFPIFSLRIVFLIVVHDSYSNELLRILILTHYSRNPTP